MGDAVTARSQLQGGLHHPQAPGQRGQPATTHTAPCSPGPQVTCWLTQLWKGPACNSPRYRYIFFNHLSSHPAGGIYISPANAFYCFGFFFNNRLSSEPNKSSFV